MPAQRPAYMADLRDEEWQILEPLLPREKSGGRPRKYAMREVPGRLVIIGDGFPIHRRHVIRECLANGAAQRIHRDASRPMPLS
jgi:transposase